MTTAKILIVDDDSATRVGLSALLHEAGYETIACGNFADARRVLESEAPDLLIADLRLNGFNGLQLVAINPRQVPAIIVTGFPDRVLEADARQMGAEYLLKPVSPAALLTIIEEKLSLERPFKGIRRWTRKPLCSTLAAWVQDWPARILDVSYGGIRFETDGTAQALPSPIRLVVPVPALSMTLDVVWSSRADDSRWLCGATVCNEHDPAWRSLVDAIP